MICPLIADPPPAMPTQTTKAMIEDDSLPSNNATGGHFRRLGGRCGKVVPSS